jgi:dUTP pyrophosphatase
MQIIAEKIKVCLINLSDTDFYIKPGDRIAQMIVAKHEVLNFKVTDKLEDTQRSEGGFGSTGDK